MHHLDTHHLDLAITARGQIPHLLRPCYISGPDRKFASIFCVCLARPRSDAAAPARSDWMSSVYLYYSVQYSSTITYAQPRPYSLCLSACQAKAAAALRRLSYEH